MFLKRFTDKLLKIIDFEGSSPPELLEIINIELSEWLGSERRKLIQTGCDYYEGRHYILKERGEKRSVYFGRSAVIDNQYKKMVDQKTNYLLGKPITFESENEAYSGYLAKIFGKNFMRSMKKAGKNSINCGIGWIYPYVDDGGELRFTCFNSTEILPFWKDDEHTELEMAARVYDVTVYEGAKKHIERHVELYTPDGADYYIYTFGRLIEDVTKGHRAYLHSDSGDYNWGRVPLVAFKYNEDERPLICGVKSLQDGLNSIMSNFQDAMLKNPMNTILILKNYDGEELAGFRDKLAETGAIKVRAIDGVEGGVDTLDLNIDSASYSTAIEQLKKAIVENAMGYDAKDDRIGSNANQMNIQSMYNDIDLDADSMETEFMSGIAELLWFVNKYLAAAGKGNYEGNDVRITFNRDMMMNESEIMQSLQSLGLRLSQRTLVSQVPFVDDPDEELRRVEDEDAEPEDYGFLGGGTGIEE